MGPRCGRHCYHSDVIITNAKQLAKEIEPQYVRTRRVIGMRWGIWTMAQVVKGKIRYVTSGADTVQHCAGQCSHLPPTPTIHQSAKASACDATFTVCMHREMHKAACTVFGWGRPWSSTCNAFRLPSWLFVNYRVCLLVRMHGRADFCPNVMK